MNESAREGVSYSKTGEEKKTIVDLGGLQPDDRKASQHSWLKRGFGEISSVGEHGKSRSVGNFFVKELEGDSRLTSRVRGKTAPDVVSASTFKHDLLMKHGVRVLPTYRVFDVDGKRYAIATDLTKEGAFVWSLNDEKVIPPEVSEKIKWPELAVDLVENASKITESGCYSQNDVYVITIDSDKTLSYAGDYDNQAVLLYGLELRDDNPEISLRAVNLIEAYRVFIGLTNESSDGDINLIKGRAQMFFERAREKYAGDDELKYDLLNKSFLDIGMGDSREMLRDVINSVFD